MSHARRTGITPQDSRVLNIAERTHGRTFTTMAELVKFSEELWIAVRKA